MTSALLAGLLGLFAPPGDGPTLDLPPRPAGAVGGRAFATSVSGLTAAEREERVRAEVLSGNVPDSWRRLVAVTVEEAGHRATFHVTPDYLAVGPDGDAFLVPLGPATAQAIGDRLRCTLPTPKMVDAIHAAARKLEPSPIPPSPEMTSVPVFLRHSETVRAQMERAGTVPGALVAGHKKDVVIARGLADRPGKVAIYGWHRPDGTPIQPLYLGHADSWIDYSHGIRLVARSLTVDGRPSTVEAVLADPALATLLSREGVVASTRYQTRGASPARLDERLDVLSLDRGVRVMIDQPATPTGRPLLLVFYALPNGNTIEQTRGRTLAPGDDWHFDIQHVAAQTRFLRAAIDDREIVVAYLENSLRSWPAWRKANGDAPIGGLIEAVRARFRERVPRLMLSGHSGGGSLIFGYINTHDPIPDEVERIAFLDANYAYETARHRDRLAAWLRASDRHALVVLAYDDAAARLDGKPFVSEAGGTWGRSRQMRADLGAVFPLTATREGPLEHVQGPGGRITFWLRENPERAVLHTVQVERNGFIEAVVAGTPRAGKGYEYLGARVYSKYVEGAADR